MTKNILQLKHNEAKEFLLQEESYNTVGFPPYIKFKTLIDEIDDKLENSNDIYKKYDNGKNIYPSKYENVNYKLFTNKDGKHAWRLLQLIHPVLYVDLVREITKECNWNDILLAFIDFQQNDKIVCASMPVVSSESGSKEQISAWSKQVEQKSIELGLEYDYIFHTDITDCYGAIYTHSIPWAIHTKVFAKENRGNKCIGNAIDVALRGMNYNQTNGIPQGSVLMDFIAEMVLGYIDECLSGCLNAKMDYHIIRYRDDYRIFTNSKQDGDTIIRELSKILSEMGMRLNGEKTYHSDDIVNSSIKKDKLHQIIHNYQQQNDLKKQLLVIKNLADNYPNSGALDIALNEFDEHLKIKSVFKGRKNLCIRRGAIKKIKEYFGLKKQFLELISILVSIALKNPRMYPIFASILSTIICSFSDKNKKKTIDFVVKKFENKSNSEYLFLWLQRIAIVANYKIQYKDKEKLFELVRTEHGDGDRSIFSQSVRGFKPIGYEYHIWNSKDWLHDDFCNIIKDDGNSIVDTRETDKLSCVIGNKEVNAFHY